MKNAILSLVLLPSIAWAAGSQPVLTGVERPVAVKAGSAVPDRSVVCKIAFSPEDATAPCLHRVLRTCGAGCVPELLAWEARGRQTWLLFAPFPTALTYLLPPGRLRAVRGNGRKL